MKLIVGLGNPGKEYEDTRHNAGRILVPLIEKKYEGKRAKFITPDTFMNNSGKEVAFYVKKKADLKDLIVVYDDIDLPLGAIKISFNKGDGGHNGLASIIKHVKSREFVRVRVGICPTTPTGKLRKPKGEDKVLKFLLGKFKKDELTKIKRLSKKATEAIEMIYAEGLPKAMSIYN